MSTDVSLKTWTITAVMTDSRLSFEKTGQVIGNPNDADSRLSPVEYLLLSAAGCMTLSLKAAAIALDLPLASIRVVASGAKPASKPSRLSTLALEIALTPPISRETFDRLIADAQQMCTVTNTLRDSAALSVRIQEPSAPPALTGSTP